LDAATGINHKGSGRILIMDDEEIFRMYAAKFLTTLGYSVVCTEDGKETLNCSLKKPKRVAHSLQSFSISLSLVARVERNHHGDSENKYRDTSFCGKRLFRRSGYSRACQLWIYR